MTDDRAPRRSRRALLRLAGAAAAGGVAGTLANPSIAAALTVNGDGGTNADGVFGTTASSTYPRAGVSGEATHVPSVGVYASHTAYGTALAAYSNGAPADPPVGYLQSNGGSTGLEVRTPGTGIVVEDALLGVDVHATGLFAIGVSAGVEGAGVYGLVASATGQSATGAAVHGGDVTLLLLPADQPPHVLNQANVVGSIVFDPNGDLWLCTGFGTPGTFRTLGGMGMAGSFYAITPTRVYDSRRPVPTPGALANGASRTISVADGRNLATGAAEQLEILPTLATAVVMNLTVTQTQGTGYLAVNEGGNSTVTSSAINWTAAGTTIANMITVPLNATRQVTVVCSPAGSAHVILDVAGYYR